MLEPEFQPAGKADVERVCERYRLPREFWLYVAHLYPHKNHQRLLEAYQQLKRQDPRAWPLVLRGDKQPVGPDISELIRRFGLAEDVILVPRLDRGDLPALYSAASALVFPSLYEGAGMPVLEALACGCPVAASEIPAVREFAGGAAYYFDPLASHGMAAAMAALAGDSSSRDRLRTAGLERARDFRATPVLERIVGAYQRASRAPRRPAPAHRRGPADAGISPDQS
jgi:glycosyltransferase involved in cell wall biosynthesis